ncbi:MAG: transporter [Planctomycetota bacterium]
MTHPAPPALSPRRLTVALLACALSAGCSTFGVQREQVTPQRPSISENTQTTAYGTFESEIGLRYDPTDEYAVETRTSVGLSPKSELFAIWDVFRDLDSGQILNDVDGDGEDETGTGDIIVGFKQRLLDETETLPATAIAISTSLPTGSDDGEISSGEIDWFGALIADRTFGRLSLTGFYQLGILGTPDVGDVDSRHTFAIDGTWALDEKINVGAELATLIEAEIDQEPVLLTAYGQYELNPSMMLDAGMRIGLSEDSPDVVFLIGLTTNLGRFF